MSTEYFDTVIVGAGHNALVCAAYLARAGQKVAIVERRSTVGGACVSEELVTGYQFSTASLVTSLFQQSIIEDLNLPSHGLAVVPRAPSVTSLLPDGSHLMLGRDPESDAAEIAKFSGRDAARYAEYGDTMHRLWRKVKSLFMGPSREPVASNPEQLRRILQRAVDLSDSDLRTLFSVMFDSARNHLDSWFESEAVKAPLAIDGVTGVAAGPSTPGTAYLMLYHHAGSTEQGRPAWGHVRGGMGGLTTALRHSAESCGATVLTGALVTEIVVDDGKAAGICLEDGTIVRAHSVVSGADPRRTVSLLKDGSGLPSAYRHAVAQLDFRGIAAKLHLALDRLPPIRGFSQEEAVAGPYRGTLLIAPTLDYLDAAYEDARAGRPSSSPHIECTTPTVLDPSLAPPGKHLMSMYIQYTPYDLAEGSWSDTGPDFADTVLKVVEDHLPGLTDSVADRVFLAPPDLEHSLGLSGGNLYHSAMSPADLFFSRPVHGYADYTTPIRNLYLCGSGTRPGGGVFGVPGRNAAKLLIDSSSS